MTRLSYDTREQILAAARVALLRDGYAGLSTRKVADGAGVPLSQLHYHFGGKQGLILRMLERDDERLLERQRLMYGQDQPLSARYEQACDFLDEDISSGYVRVLQELIAAGWSNEETAVAARAVLARWFGLLTAVAEQVQRDMGGLGPFTPEQVGALTGMLFMGAESLLLLGMESDQVPLRSALRAVAELLRGVEP